MTQQYQTRVQRITMLIALFALVVVIAQNVAAGTKYVAIKKESMEQCANGSVKTGIISVASGIEDLPWSPVLNFFR